MLILGQYFSSTELVYVDGSGTEEAGPLNIEPGFNPRGVMQHRLVTVDLPKPKVFAIGGQHGGCSNCHRDTVEEWEPLTQTWKTTEMKTHAGMSTFGAIAINFDFVCPNQG